MRHLQIGGNLKGLICRFCLYDLAGINIGSQDSVCSGRTLRSVSSVLFHAHMLMCISHYLMPLLASPRAAVLTGCNSSVTHTALAANPCTS